MDVALAIDIGGTKLAAGLVSHTGEILRRRAVPTPNGDDPERLWERLAGLVVDMLEVADGGGTTAGERTVVCGVGCGGPMAPGGVTVSPLNIPAWREFPLLARLTALVQLPVHIDNDAKALALGEGWVGTARGVRNFVAMVVSTGVGGGLVVDGRLLEGAAGNAGHIGHVIVVPDGRRCGCEAHGCLEAEASGLAIAAVTADDPAAAGEDVRRRTGTLVGRAVASVANLLDLRLAVVAGSVALGYGSAFFAAAQAEIDARARISFTRGTRIVPAGLGDAGPLVGAAAVGWRAAGHDIGIG